MKAYSVDFQKDCGERERERERGGGGEREFVLSTKRNCVQHGK